MNEWQQLYDPFSHTLASGLLASLPVAGLLIALGIFHIRAHWAAMIGLVSAMMIAIGPFGMPWSKALIASMYGAAYGIFPIGWIVFSAILLFEVSVVTGQFQVLRRAISQLSSDPRIQVLLIAFSFGAFIEGAAGFGTPVAVSAAMLMGLGFRPLQAAGLALIGNTAPVAFGALGTPVLMLAKVTQLPVEELSSMVGRQLPFFSLLIPFWLVGAMVGWREMIRVWPACLTAGASFGLVQFAISNYHGPWLVDIAASLASIGSLMVLLRYWKAPSLSRSLTCLEDSKRADAESPSRKPVDLRAVGIALVPWLTLTIAISAWGIPTIQKKLDRTTFVVPIPGLHQQIVRMPPIVEKPEPEKVEFKVNWLSATGTALFLASMVSGLFLGLSPSRILGLLGQTLKKTSLSLLTIALMLALGYTTRLSGLDAAMGLAFAKTGWFFPFFSPLLGWLGVALTGSDTSSNILFGNLQQITANQLGISPILATASNSSGGVMGKMIDAQSIVVANVATGEHVHAGVILRYVFLHSLTLACLVGLLVMTQAYVLPRMIP